MSRRVLFDAPSTASTSAQWVSLLSELSHTLRSSDRRSTVDAFLTTDPEFPKSISLERIDFPRRLDAFAFRAAEAQLLTRVAQSRRIDVFASVGASYALGIPNVVVRLDDNPQSPEFAVATSMASQVVCHNERQARKLQRAFPFIRDDMIAYPANASDTHALARLVIDATDRAMSNPHDVWQNPEAVALAGDYQARAVKLQV